MERNKVLSTKREKKKSNAPMPASSAGLLRFFEDESDGLKIKPQIVLVLAGTLIVASILLRIFPVI